MAPVATGAFIYGVQGRLMIHLAPTEGHDWDIVTFTEADEVAMFAITFYGRFVEAGRRWVPTADVNVKWDDHEGETYPTAWGYIGNPRPAT